MAKTARRPLRIDRRFVLKGGSALAGAALTPTYALAKRGDEPTGQTAVVDLDETQSVDVAVLEPGELVVVATAGTYYGILRRTPAQIEIAQTTKPERDPVADVDRRQDESHLVIDMTCSHRGCQVGYRDDAEAPFLCPCHRASYDAAGRVLGGPARSNLSVPDYAIDGTVITFI